MASPSYAILFQVVTSGVTGTGDPGDVLIENTAGTAYVRATAANRGTRRSTGIALTTYVNNTNVEIQQSGQVSASIASTLGAGTASWVRVSSTGTLERCTPSGSDDVCGWVEADGTFHAQFGYLTATIVNGSGGGGGATLPIDLAGGAGTVINLLPVGNQAAQTMAGDVTGTTAASTVAKVNGATYPAAGALVTGTVPRVTGTSAVAYGALDLANASAITGVLPSASAPSHAGDVTGAHTATVVVKINGASVPAAGALTTGNIPQVSGASALTYGPLNLAGGSNFVTGSLPIGNLAAGSSGQYFQTVGSTPTWVYATQTGGYRTVRAVATANITLSGTQTIDGVACIAGDRVLCAGQTTGTNNGIYVVAAGAWAYAADWATNLVVSGMRIGVTEGSVNGDTSWFCITTGTLTVGSTSINFVRDLATPVTTGNVLQVSGGAAVYGAVNLAGGGSYVTGVLPTSNQASQTMAGDVTGTTAASVVAKINGATVPAAGALTTAHVLKVSGASATTYGFILDANVAASAAVSGTKISPNFGAQDVITTGSYATGTSPATAGNIRLPATSAVNFLSSGSANTNLISTDGADNITIGQATVVSSTNITTLSLFVHADATHFQDRASSVNLMRVDTTAIQPVIPIIGYVSGNSPYGVHGKTTVATAGAHTMTAAEYSLDAIMFSASTGGTYTFPLPASDAAAYYKTIIYTGNSTAVITNGGGAPKNVTVAANTTMRCLFDTAGVHPLSGSAGAYP